MPVGELKIDIEFVRNFADSVVNSALRFRAQAPIVDQLLREIGLESGDIQRLTAGVSGGAAALPPAQQPAAQGPQRPREN